MQGRKVYTMQRFVKFLEPYLKANSCEIKVGPMDTPEEMIENAIDCDAMIVGIGKVNRNVLEKLKKIKVIGRLGVGVDNIDVESAEELGIWITNGPYSNSNSVAEFTITAICNLAKKYPLIMEYMKKDIWEEKIFEMMGFDIEGKTLGLIGIGKIGSLVAKKAHSGLGMKVICYDKYASPDKLPEGVKLYENIEDVVKEADFVSLHAPLSKETEGLFDERMFSLMKPTSYFINMARGPIADEDALYRALRDNKIAGAALDAFSVEPPNINNPIFQLKNVYATPHKATLTVDAQRNMALDAAKGVVEVLDGRVPTYAVNNPKNK